MSDEHLNMMSDEQLVHLLNFVARPIIEALRERGCEIELAHCSTLSPVAFRVSRNRQEIVGSR